MQHEVCKTGGAAQSVVLKAESLALHHHCSRQLFGLGRVSPCSLDLGVSLGLFWPCRVKQAQQQVPSWTHVGCVSCEIRACIPSQKAAWAGRHRGGVPLQVSDGGPRMHGRPGGG